MAVKTFGPVDEASLKQMQACVQVGRKEEVDRFGEVTAKYFGLDGAGVVDPTATFPAMPGDVPAVLCADHHKGYAMPIGGVIGYRNLVSPSAVGYDIGCGNMAVRTPLNAADVDVPAIMDEIAKHISFGMGRSNKHKDERVGADILSEIAASPVEKQRKLLQTAREQLGTVGGGNHYVDLFTEEATGKLWVGVHFGSRGFGWKTAAGFMALAQGKSWGDRPDDAMDAPPAVIKADTAMGEDYGEAMRIAGEYAYAGRRYVVATILDILGTRADLTVHNHHNFAWREQHGADIYWVHRKGATPAFPGQLGFVGGSMGDHAVILQGIESVESKAALYSTVHGAGRVMSRTAAAGKLAYKYWECDNAQCRWTFRASMFDDKQAGHVCTVCNGGRLWFKRSRGGIRLKGGVIDWAATKADLQAKGIYLIGGDAEEAPGVYKRLPEVLDYHRGTVEILHTLRPVGVIMAGPETVDLYKD